jgi:hypothetical protein
MTFSIKLNYRTMSVRLNIKLGVFVTKGDMLRTSKSTLSRAFLLRLLLVCFLVAG